MFPVKMCHFTAKPLNMCFLQPTWLLTQEITGTSCSDWFEHMQVIEVKCTWKQLKVVQPSVSPSPLGTVKSICIVFVILVVFYVIAEALQLSHAEESRDFSGVPLLVFLLVEETPSGRSAALQKG